MIISLQVVTGCKKSKTENPQPTPAPPPAALAIGQAYEGGIIAYIYKSGDPGYVAGQTHGLVASSSDLCSGPTWSPTNAVNGSHVLVDYTSTALGTGNHNTSIIAGFYGPGLSYAARVCFDFHYGSSGSSSGNLYDWYLPSKDELHKLYLSKDIIGGFSSNEYWSSSEYDSQYAWAQNFANGSQHNIDKTSPYVNTRAIKYF